MKNFYTFDPRGNIITAGACRTEDVQLHEREGETLVESDFPVSAATHYVGPQSLLEYTTEQRAAKAARPAGARFWDNELMAWQIDAEITWGAVRYLRDQRLLESDWTRNPQYPLSTEKAAAWAAYRQALFDITQQPDPTRITWPTSP